VSRPGKGTPKGRSAAGSTNSHTHTRDTSCGGEKGLSEEVRCRGGGRGGVARRHSGYRPLTAVILARPHYR
jgi:hypothetical protein